MFICVWQKKGSDHKQAADLVQSNNEGFCKSDLKYLLAFVAIDK